MTVEFQWPGASAGGDQEVCGVVGDALDRHGVRSSEPRLAVQRVHSVAGESVLHPSRDRVGEAVLVLDQVGPVDRQAGSVDSFAPHQSGAVDDLGTATQDLLRVAPTQCAGAAVRKRVDDRDALLTVTSGEDEGVMFGDDVEWCVEGPAGGFGGALLFMVSWWWSGCRHSVVTSVMAARVEDSSTMALPAA